VIIPTPTVESLDVVPGHSSIPEIERWVFPGVPYLTSVHSIDAAEDSGRQYCEVHCHPDLAEVNVLLGITSDFRFRIQIGCTTEVVGPTAALFIPAGVPHSANVVSGRGFYVVHHVRDCDNGHPTAVEGHTIEVGETPRRSAHGR
jgi:hypothetical protein